MKNSVCLFAAAALLAAESRGASPVRTWVDAANRCCFLDASGLPGERYVFTFPDGEAFTNASPVFRRRLPSGAGPFGVRVRALPSGAEAAARVEPRARPLQAPLADGEILVGHCVYDGNAEFRDEIATNNLCNLLVAWSKGAAYTNLPPAIADAAARNGLHFMTIYGWDPRPVNDALRAAFGSRYLANNIGEYAGYLYQRLPEAKTCKVPQRGNLDDVRNRFINAFIRPEVESRHRDYDFIFSTSGSPLAAYEMQGGMDFMCCELYAVGAHNLAYATSEMRGAARKWKPEFWGGWLAEEWQTFPVPYDSRQKYDLLKVSLYQQYLMGTSVIVLESGAQGTQAQNYTAGAAKRKQGYRDPAPTAYRRTVKEFYDWLRAHPRAKGSPETPIAFVLGNNDGYVGMCHPIFAVWGQHETAATNANWKYTLPEETWATVQDTFFPTPADALAPYSNSWLGGTPFGPCDILSIDSEARLSDLSRYSLVAYAGWNTMTPSILRVLASYVRGGGSLVICLPHFSTRLDREHRAYSAADLVNAGDLRPLLDLRVKGPARFELGPACRVTRRDSSGAPLIIEESLGKGRVTLLAAWNYPGHGTPAAALYAETLKAAAAAVPARAAISGPGADYIAYACYGRTLYLLNTDCVKARAFTLRAGGKTAELTLAPTEFRALRLD